MKKTAFHFEFLTRSWKMKTFTLSYQLDGYPYIIFSYCSQCLFSKWNLFVAIKHRSQKETCYFHVQKTLGTKTGDG